MWHIASELAGLFLIIVLVAFMALFIKGVWGELTNDTERERIVKGLQQNQWEKTMMLGDEQMKEFIERTHKKEEV
ncbi:hypothetical protein [Facklamia sp. P12955]|uniref:hypothetical protein n=1 Tax=Facklamia sp. P12955 TaxID=3421946 RepID=UPI003D1874FF